MNQSAGFCPGWATINSKQATGWCEEGGGTTDLYIPHLQKPPNSTPVSCLSHRLQPQEGKPQVRKAENLLCEQS